MITKSDKIFLDKISNGMSSIFDGIHKRMLKESKKKSFDYIFGCMEFITPEELKELERRSTEGDYEEILILYLDALKNDFADLKNFKQQQKKK